MKGFVSTEYESPTLLFPDNDASNVREKNEYRIFNQNFLGTDLELYQLILSSQSYIRLFSRTLFALLSWKSRAINAYSVKTNPFLWGDQNKLLTYKLMYWSEYKFLILD